MSDPTNPGETVAEDDLFPVEEPTTTPEPDVDADEARAATAPENKENPAPENKSG